jgi:hypothetical protein
VPILWLEFARRERLECHWEDGGWASGTGDEFCSAFDWLVGWRTVVGSSATASSSASTSHADESASVTEAAESSSEASSESSTCAANCHLFECWGLKESSIGEFGDSSWSGRDRKVVDSATKDDTQVEEIFVRKKLTHGPIGMAESSLTPRAAK